MIIVSQDKETLLNFDNIQNIRIEEYGTHEKGKKIYKIFSGNFEGYTKQKKRQKQYYKTLYLITSVFVITKMSILDFLCLKILTIMMTHMTIYHFRRENKC